MNALFGGDISARLEVVVGTVWMLKLCLLVVFVRYIRWELLEHGLERFRLQAAVSLALKELGNLLVLGWVWIYLYLTTRGDGVDWMQDYPVSVTGLIIVGIGALYMVSVFTNERCGHRTWVISGMLALAAAAGIRWLL